MGDAEPRLTSWQAYLCMHEFLRRRWMAYPSIGLPQMLGAMPLLPEGRPADAAYEDAWREAVRAVLEAENTPGGYRGADLRLG